MSEPFERQLKRAQDRVNDLRRTAGREGPQPAWTLALWEELATNMEELHVALEELRQQNDELASARQQVEAERANYQELFDFAPEAYLVTDALGIVRQANEAAALLLRHRSDFIPGKPLATFVSPADHTEFRQRVSHLAESGKTERWEARFATKDGLDIPVAISVACMGGAGGVKGLRWNLRDVSAATRAELRVSELLAYAEGSNRELISLRNDQQQIEAALREREHLLSQAQHIGHVGGWKYDIAKDELTGSDEWYRIFGWTPGQGDMTLEGYMSSIHPDDQDATRARVIKVIRDGEAYEVEKRIVRPGGDTRIVHTTMQAELDAEGKPVSIVGICQDVTERKKLELQFLRSQRMESIGTLASGVAHDLNNILAPIMMSAPLLRRDLTPEQREGILSTIEVSAERGAQIIKQVLTFGRGVTGERHLLQIGALVKELVKIMRETFPRNIEIESTLEPDLWLLVGDITQLHQVLMNLCVNARDSMPDGGCLRLNVTNLDLDESYASMIPEVKVGPHIVIEVSDTGSGIAPEIIERIFDPFFTTKGVGKGTGLGLSTALGIVKSHGGAIRLSSQLGRGTTFQVYLPAAPKQEEMPPVTPPGKTPQGNGELVLVVDDEDAVRRAVHLVLENRGFHVLPAADGAEALALFSKNQERVAAVITDLMMPVMDGITLIRALRALVPELPIIASTGLGEKTQIAALNELNVETILHKPYGAATLIEAVHRALHPMPVAPVA